MCGRPYLAGNATELGAAVDVLMPAMVDGPFKSGDAAGVVAGVYLLSASLNTAPVQYSGNLASLLGTYSDVSGRKLLQEESEEASADPVATPSAGAAPPLSPEAAEVLRRRATREHLAASVINASSFANADPGALADALNDITASAGEVSLKAQGDVTRFVTAAVLSSMAPRPAGDTTPVAGIAEELGAVYTAVASNVLAAGLNPDSSPAARVAFISKSTAGPHPPPLLTST